MASLCNNTTGFFARTRTIAVVFACLVLCVAIAMGEEDKAMTVKFVNEMPDTDIELYWENKANGERRIEGTISPRGGYLDVNTFEGHEFSYDLDGKRHYFVPPVPKIKGQDQFAILVGENNAVPVRCHLRQRTPHNNNNEGGEEINEEEDERPSPLPPLDNLTFDITVKPYWAPRGASRFLELVRSKYYDGVALNRVVPQFLLQFGIASDYDTRMLWEDPPIVDDLPIANTQFRPGYVSFAGSGADSRTAEIFVVMPGTEQEQLDYFGENSWETPFGMMEGVDVEEEDGGGGTVLDEIYDGYGDMPPWGRGPDPDKIYDEDGYDYLRKEFPKLDYIDRCYIVSEENMGDDFESVEL
mmetsp:Transcript_8344/g.18059  ORF Transcript_8344/g.18059 Transcript_8344/m.18059 type:complete len:356 (-) Transcript_8344:181-1248(-)|eukprot:CAMPEP_0183715282 /NCGR_PEP_ID=MMETSP0737-20130205/9576_1 /TAXON_ID=385413 /ORGANISM="Thalassiosira miniscula, Strain CCMP1093" /LENGTH=355 /DNA_ID=CAMNT_0025944373 /DNA_START=117 /DNA_END=1184 /DNA_ORIENTATION=+